MSGKSYPVGNLVLIILGWAAFRVLTFESPDHKAQAIGVGQFAKTASERPIFLAGRQRGNTRPKPIHLPLPELRSEIALIAVSKPDKKAKPLIVRMGMPPLNQLESPQLALRNDDSYAPEPDQIRSEPGGLAQSPIDIKPKGMRLSSWSIWRPSGQSNALASNGHLGGSQIGARILAPLDQSGLKASARLSKPVSVRGGEEGAIGLYLTGNAPVAFEIGVERRVAIGKGGRNAFAILAAAGLYDHPGIAGTKLNGYGQTGIVGLRNTDAFVDGAVTLERPLKLEGVEIGYGFGAWGSAQPRLSRLDIGPQVSARLSIKSTSLRLTGSWRIRAAGNAKPGSGPAVTVGADF